MNCLDVRRRMLAEPASTAEAVRTHLLECAPCAEFSARTTTLEESLSQALAVSVPPALVQDIMAHTSKRDGLRRRNFIALAASLTAIATLGAGFAWLERDDPLALACIDFVIEEEANAILSSSKPDPETLRNVTALMGVEFPRQLGSVRYVGRCVLRGIVTYHVIATTPQGKVTLLLFPDRPDAGTQAATARGLRAAVIPAGSGSVALVGNSRRSLERTGQMLLRG